MAKPPFVALTPQQINSWPAKSRPDLDIEGNPVDIQTKQAREDAFLQLARERFRLSKNASDLQRSEMQEDLNFYAPTEKDGQWDPAAKASRAIQDRPTLTINRMPGFVNHVSNNMRQSRPAIKIVPTGDPGANDDMAEVRQGIIRYIEQNSRADIPYDTSFEHMCIMGIGWMRVVDDWAEPGSFDKDLFIRWVKNPFSVYWDPFCQQPDWSDMKFAFVVEDLTRREFIAKYGEEFAVDDGSFKSIGDQSADWFTGGKIRVAEYFYVENKDDISCEMSDKTTRYYSDLKRDDPEGFYDLRKEDGDTVLYFQDTLVGRTRPDKRPTVKWALMTGLNVIQGRTWKGKFIPLIPTLGNQIQKNGETILVGMVRYAREPQRMYNYAYSQFVETVALAPRSPFVAEVDQVPDGLIEEWRDANKTLTSVLRYKGHDSPAGNLVPPPQRQQAEPPIAAFVQLLTLCDNMMKSVFSIYDASLGQKGPQESGLAINARKIESDTGTYNWGDNFIRSLRYLGMVLDDLSPHYYNTPGRVLQITQEDQTIRKLVMNDPTFEEEGKFKHLDLSKNGKYTAVVSTGPSQTVLRQESANAMMELYKADQNLIAITADLFIENLDFPNKEAMIDRVRKSLPPALQPQDENTPPIPPQVQAQMAQMQQMIQQLSQALHAATDKTEQQKIKEEYALLRTEMTNNSNQIIQLLKQGHAQAEFLSEKQFQEAERLQMKVEPPIDPALSSSPSGTGSA